MTREVSPEVCAAIGELPLPVDWSRVRLYRAGCGRGAGLARRLVLWLSRGRAVALGNHVFLPARCDGDLALMAHEVTHCAQYQSWGPWRYFTRGAAAQIRDLALPQVRRRPQPLCLSSGCRTGRSTPTAWSSRPRSWRMRSVEAPRAGDHRGGPRSSEVIFSACSGHRPLTKGSIAGSTISGASAVTWWAAPSTVIRRAFGRVSAHSRPAA